MVQGSAMDAVDRLSHFREELKIRERKFESSIEAERSYSRYPIRSITI